MMRVGLTGSIASGKSEVARHFRTRGIAVFDADEAVHAIYADAQDAQLIAAAFPDAWQGGVIDRGRLSAHLIANPQDFSKLEQLVHPLVRQRREKFLRQHETDQFVILDIPLLFETGEDKQMDCTITVITSDALQRQRALARPGMTEEKLARILARQMPAVEKAKRADFVIDNSGSMADLHGAIDHLIAKLTERAGHFS